MILHLLRHSLTKYNELGKTNGQTIEDPLSEEGIRRTHAFAESLRQKIDTIYTSDLLRARQTAEIIARHINTKIIEAPELREIHLGSLTGLSWKEINDKVGRNLLEEYKAQQYDFRPFGGESFEDVHDRIARFVQRVKENDEGKNIFVITHGGIVRYFKYKYQNQKGQEIVNNLEVADFEI